MEIVIVVIVALCILLTWGPRVLLAVIATPFLLLALVFAFIVIKQELATNSREQAITKPVITKICAEDGEWVYRCLVARP